MTVTKPLQVCNIPANQPWLFDFLKDELKPYPNRFHTVARMVLSATLTMLVIMTLRSPNGAIGIFFGLLISRENPANTLKSGLQTILAFIAGLVYTLLGVTLSLNEPLPHFVFIALSLALMFFIIRTVKSFSAAFGFCFIVVTTLPVWEPPFSVNAQVDSTLWSVFGVILAVCVAMTVELIFCPRQNTTEEIRKGVNYRLDAMQALFQAYVNEQVTTDSPKLERIKQMARLGARQLKWFLARSSIEDSLGLRKARWGSYISAVERLVDTASNLGIPRKPLTEVDKSRLLALQNACRSLRLANISENIPVQKIGSFSENLSRALPLLSDLERQFERLPQLLNETSLDEKKTEPTQWSWRQLFLADAFVSVEYLHFAVKGTLAGLACYVFYSAVDWPGLGNSLATCVITALSTVGSSRQKQILRMGGAILGGLILGIGSQIYILPHLDSILGFTLFFGIITALSAWVTTASPRLSYFGLQMALAFYLIMFQSTAIPTDLTIGRDRVIGTLLGLVAMWGIFDQLWAKPAIQEMKEAFAANMKHLGTLSLAMLSVSPSVEAMDILRERINNGFNKMDGNADMILFEFGRARAEHLYWRSRLENWQNTQESLLLAQLAVNHYRSHMQISDWPESLQAALLQFNQALAKTWYEVGLRVTTTPDLALNNHVLEPLLVKLRQEVFLHFASRPDEMGFHNAEAILDLDEQIVLMTETLIKEVSAA